MKICKKCGGKHCADHWSKCLDCGETFPDSSQSASWVLNVTEDDHVADCPKCGKMIRADSIDFDDAKCPECGINLRVNVAPNEIVSGGALDVD